MIYVMSDIHGYYNSFIKMLEKINFNNEDKLYVIGDLIDRGPSSLKIIEYCRRHDNIEVLKGNHEYMLEMANKDRGLRKCWLRSGGDITLDELEESYKDDSEYEKSLNEWVENLPLFESVKVNGNEFFLTHAGISKDLFNTYRKKFKLGKWHKIDLLDLFEWAVNYLDYDENNILWSKGIFGSKFTFTRDYLVIGHTPTKSKKIEKINKVYNIDCGSYEENGYLGCLCLDNFKEFYVSTSDE